MHVAVTHFQVILIHVLHGTEKKDCNDTKIKKRFNEKKKLICDKKNIKAYDLFNYLYGFLYFFYLLFAFVMTALERNSQEEHD